MLELHTLIGVGCVSALALFVLSRCFFLSASRLGWLMMTSNALYETAEKKLGWDRRVIDAVLVPAVTAGVASVAGAPAAAVVAVVMGLSWVAAWQVESAWRSGSLARQDADLERSVPFPVPQLITVIRGPILRRSSHRYDLGVWPAGLAQGFEILVLNPSRVCPQVPLMIEVTTKASSVQITGGAPPPLVCPEPGEIASHRFAIRADASGPGGEVVVTVRHGDLCHTRRLLIRWVVSLSGGGVCSAAIRRWKYGCCGAFVWRGDHDLHDPSTFQSVDGLRLALGLARRFRFPSSLMVSSRLSLVEREHREFCDHFGWDRRSAEIPGFVSFLREEVDTSPEQEWPTQSSKRFSAEIGNHFHLHYGTHAAADPGNHWKVRARMGDGAYSWMTGDRTDSFGEQRDNAIEGSRVLREVLGVEAVSFTIPGDVYDAETARAVEAAGLEVGSETDAGKVTKLIGFPPPHHPEGCERFVELTRMYPRDPQNAHQVAMLKYWAGVARRKRRALVFLSHHHLKLYEGNVCLHLTEELLRSILADHEGDLQVATLASTGRYWRDVLSERTRCVDVKWRPEAVTISNRGSRPLSGLPLEIETDGGARFMRIVDVPAGSTVTVGF